MGRPLHRLGVMRRNPRAAVLSTAGLVSVALLMGVGCSSNEKPTPPSSESQSPTATSELPPLPPEQTPPGAVGISAGGVTTKVDVPSDATESQYGQACHAAKVWMDGEQGDPQAMVESYLKTLQVDGAVGPGSFDTPWAKLTPAQQAGVIMAVTGAASGQCE